MSENIPNLAKQALRRFFAIFGLRVSQLPKSLKKGATKYFNTGELTPIQENSRELYERFYGDHAALEEYYDDFRLGFYSAISLRMRELGISPDGRDVLDVGCGTGHLMAEISTWSSPRSLTGCDFSDEAMKFSLQRFPECRFFTHDIYLPLADSYDLILCTEVLEHLERPYVAIRNLVNAARAGGEVVITVPNGRTDTLIEHINFWSPESWKAFLERECPECVVETSLLMNERLNFAWLRGLPQGSHKGRSASQ